MPRDQTRQRRVRPLSRLLRAQRLPFGRRGHRVTATNRIVQPACQRFSQLRALPRPWRRRRRSTPPLVLAMQPHLVDSRHGIATISHPIRRRTHRTHRANSLIVNDALFQANARARASRKMADRVVRTAARRSNPLECHVCARRIRAHLETQRSVSRGTACRIRHAK